MFASVGPNNPRKRKRNEIKEYGHREIRQKANNETKEQGALATEDQDETKASDLRLGRNKIRTLPNELLGGMILGRLNIRDLSSCMKVSTWFSDLARGPLKQSRRKELLHTINLVVSTLEDHMKRTSWPTSAVWRTTTPDLIRIRQDGDLTMERIDALSKHAKIRYLLFEREAKSQVSRRENKCDEC